MSAGDLALMLAVLSGISTLLMAFAPISFSGRSGPLGQVLDPSKETVRRHKEAAL